MLLAGRGIAYVDWLVMFGQGSRQRAYPQDRRGQPPSVDFDSAAYGYIIFGWPMTASIQKLRRARIFAMGPSRIRPGDAALEIQRLRLAAATGSAVCSPPGSIPVCYQCRTSEPHDFFVQGPGPTQQHVWYHYGCLRPRKADSAPRTPARGDAQHIDAEMLDRPHRPAEILDKGAQVAAENGGSSVQAYDNTPPVAENGESSPQAQPIDTTPGTAETASFNIQDCSVLGESWLDINIEDWSESGVSWWDFVGY